MAEVSKLGEGENFCSYLLSAKDKKFVLRVSIRDREDVLANEFEILKLLPDSVGPRPISLDVSRQLLPYPFMVQSFIDGETVSNWSEVELRALARTMAKFHSIKRNAFGGLKDKKSKLVVVDFLQQVNSYFFNNNQGLLKDNDIKDIRPKVLSFLQKHQELFDTKTSFSLIHGDMTVQNMLFDGKRLRIIDWETACFGDNAQDFATFYYDDFAYHKWRVHLNSEQIEILITEYLKYFPDDTLRERIKVWHTFDKFCSLVYCKWKQMEYKDNPNEKVTITPQELESEIEKITKSLLSLV